MTTEIVTIGVYGWNEERFFQALGGAGVTTFCDLRDRRGVRGSEYAFANSARLQARLEALGIQYVPCRELGASQELRAVQDAADRAARTARRARRELSPEFVAAYRRERLEGFDSRAFIESLGPEARVVALFCVERDPAACHRSLVADRLEEDLNLRVVHLVP